MDIPHFVYLFQLVDIWVVTFFCYYNCCYEYLCKSFCMDICFKFSCYIPRSGISGPYDNSKFTILHSYQTVFQSSIPFYNAISSILEFRFLHILPKTGYHLIDIFILTTLVDMKGILLSF